MKNLEIFTNYETIKYQMIGSHGATLELYNNQLTSLDPTTFNQKNDVIYAKSRTQANSLGRIHKTHIKL